MDYATLICNTVQQVYAFLSDILHRAHKIGDRINMQNKLCYVCRQPLKHTKPDAIDNTIKRVLMEHPEYNTIPLILIQGLGISYTKTRSNRVAKRLRALGYLRKSKRFGKRVTNIWVKQIDEDYTQDL